MRKTVVDLKQARPAIRNLIQSMKNKYSGRNVQFASITTVADADIERKLPSKVKSYLQSVPNVRKVGHEQGVEFYYYRYKSNENQITYILPIILIYAFRNDNNGQQAPKLLVCDLNTYLPKLKEDIDVDSILDELVYNRIKGDDF